MSVRLRTLLAVILIVPLLAGCETLRSLQDGPSTAERDEPRQKPKPKPTAEALLTSGVREFEEGNYVQAERLLRASLAAGLGARASRARAHKYLAFTYCVSGRNEQCRQEFSRALQADPKFSLTAAEAGHPIWGPAFRSVSQGN